MTRLAAPATGALDAGGAGGLGAVELAIRAAMTKLGCSLLEQLLAADSGHRGARIDCGQGHQAAFVGYRPKHLDTVLGAITLRRAYYHCGDCGRGVSPKVPMAPQAGCHVVG